MDRYPYNWHRPVEMEKKDIFIDESQHNLPFCAQTTDMAPSFTTDAWDPIDKKIKNIRLEDYRGKWVILFFYASDFTFV